MSQIDIPSPCVGICILESDTGLCRGCWRSGAEIADWPGMPNEARMALLAVLRARRGGRARPRKRPARARFAGTPEANEGG
ncbi:DUF1289 domain-containing protein [Oceanibacterium hippocampi]|uniref:Fe-S protein n=1 Tax=Oceanibacterium hippocampi TaxID=745714 RepID=A0A1Y5TYD0_9PROT|nr:DUF1289 domain-containing protein [Oceanibacterium hippocampi]SLN76885.1 hypothetical protein OCH7691_04222 [Oceanibacterium hippocampi]